MVKGKLEVNIILNSSSCYYMQTGKCSLDIIDGMYVSPNVRLSPGELLYCPRLYRMMCSPQESLKPISVVPCKCGHANVVSANQRACIASKKNIEQELLTADKIKENCRRCAGQITFEKNAGTSRNVVLKARIKDE